MFCLLNSFILNYTITSTANHWLNNIMKNMWNWLQWFFLYHHPLLLNFFLLRGAGGQHHFPQIEKKITLLLILQFLMKNLLKTIKNKQRYIITGEVKLRFVMRNRLKRGWYAQQFTYLQRNNFLYFSCKKLSSNWKLEKKW